MGITASPPRGAAESMPGVEVVTAAGVARIAAEVLERPAVGVDQDVFALGADSLRAVELLARVRDAFGVDLALDELFAAPTPAGLAALVERAAAGTEPPLVPRPTGGGPVPLSFAQRRLWFLHQLAPANPVHNLGAAVRLTGRLSVSALAAAFAEIVRRHEALRTAFIAGGGAGDEPAQVVLPQVEVPLPVVDLAALAERARERTADALARALGRLPFAIERGEVMRLALLRLGAAEHELVLAFHHIAADGGSLAVLARELAALLGGRAAHAGLPPLPVQVADHALWQRRCLTEAALTPALAWWRERLGGELPVVELPADRPRPPVLSHRGAHRESRIGPALAAGVERLARRAGATPFMVLLAAFAALVHRHAGQADLVLGTPVAGRDRLELRGLVGIFLNNLVLRVDAAGGPGFGALLGRVRETVLGAFAHQQVPFERLVDELRPARDLSRTPLFQVMFVGQNAPLAPLALPGLRLVPRELDLGTARFDLAVSMAPSPPGGPGQDEPAAPGGGWSATWKFSTDLFDGATIRRLAGHFERLLAAALDDPELPIGRLALLAPAERHQVLAAWNDTAEDWPETPCLHQLIAAQAARTPRAVALADGGERLTYEELLRRAAALAARLRRLGVGAESLVGVAAERSTAMVVGLLGTLLAGGAYVPLDPDHPAERLAFVLADSGIEVLLVQGHLRARLRALPERLEGGGRVLELDAGEATAAVAIAPAPAVPAAGAQAALTSAVAARPRPVLPTPPAPPLPASPAYAIYTSGSTGRPKGAMVPHAGIVNRLLWMQRAYRLGPEDRVLQKTPFSFDVSVWEFFWPLLAGARLVMAPPGAHQDPARLLALIREHAITTLHFVPSMLQVFVEQPGLATACGTVRRIFASGEALPPDLAARCRERLPGTALHNLYGPTEASVDVTFHPCQDGDRQSVPIGRPIANTVILLLDRRGQPVPAGVPGELHIGGVGLARGYLGRPDLTAERFVPDAWGAARGEAGARLYCTGDLARFRADGEVEFLGRLDHQVKVRGVRIELGEIEAALARHPRVREAVVLARRDAGAGEVRLVAYVVPAGGATGEALAGEADAASTPAELRAFLRRSLTEAMVPSAFVVLPALPLNASGKVDRRALPAPAAERLAAAPADEEPATPLERRLAALWSEVLGIGSVGRHDNFFELGGDSIQGAMLVNRLQRELGAIVYVMALFDAPTPARLAAYLLTGYPEAAARLAAGTAASRMAGPAEAETAAEQGAPAAHGASAESKAPVEPRAPAEPEAPAPPEAPAAPSLGTPEGVATALAELRAAVARRLGRAGAVAEGERAPAIGESAAARRNPPAVFLLSPFRSGSTLLRVMLAGHPRLFAPPELELLAFGTMGERRRVYDGRNRFAREGLLRAVMELLGCDADRAERLVGAAEDEDLSVGEWYGRLQAWCGGRLLVDKTPSYALDGATLARAERLFERPLYVHLTRHPVATVLSYVEARMDRVYHELPFAPEVQGELVWLAAHDNVLRFLAGVPAERQLRLRFEDLLAEPRRRMEELGRFLGVGFEPGMLEPYAGGRMTDGPRAGSRMMGDPKFHQHRGIDPDVARRSEAGAAALAALSAPARELAARLGYELPAPVAAGAAGGARPPAPVAAPQAGQAPVAVDAAGGELALRPVPRGEGGELPLSFAQERLWFLAQLDPASPAYNMPAAVRLAGRLHVPALGRSFAEVHRRHEVLRTCFPAAQGRPVQRIAPPASADRAAPLPVVGLGALPAAARAAEWRRLALAEGRRPFDLARGPLLRAALLALSGGEHVLLVTLHHVVSDGWTVGVLMRELSALYRAFRDGRPPALPPLPLQYADYAWHQRCWLAGDAMAAHLAWWRRRLAGPLPPLELPTDRPRPAVQTLRGARLSRTLDAGPTEAVRAFGAAAGATFFLALLAAWSALLHRYTGQDDLLLGIPIANRNRLEVEGLIGVFLNMVVQRTDAAGDPPFAGLLGRVRDGFLASIPHQEVPFERLVEELQPQRDLARTPIFQIQFSLQNTPSEPLTLPGLDVEMLEDHNRTTKFDLTVFLFDLPGGLTTTLEYNAHLFDEATMARLLAHWETLLTGAVSAAGTRLADLPLLTAAERRQLLAGWNEPSPGGAPGTADAAPPFSVPAAASLHHLFAAQAARAPGAVAAVHDLDEITYGRLDEGANRLAWRLRGLGVGPEVRVGLCLERSLDLVTGILGILKAGGAYVPLDPDSPPERLAWILGDAMRGSAPPVLVTSRALAARLAPAAGVEPPYQAVLLDEERGGPGAASAGAAATGPPPALPGDGLDSAAYVIYTSGSTGRPKGVVVTHAQVVRLFRATEAWFDFGPDDVWSLFHSFAFDFSVWEIWGALLYGGRLVVVPREVSRSPEAFYDLLVGERVSVLSQTPSVFRHLVRVDEDEGGRLGRQRGRPLRLVVFGGEALDTAALAPWVARHGDDQPALINMYGITETTVHVTYRRVRAADCERAGASPIGRPIPDLQLHVLGRRLELLPVGVPGEIHVGGAGVARGYLGRPELTAERFVPDPFAAPRSGDLRAPGLPSARPGARLYRSGDLARRLPDGDLHYLGRIDGQVKIRGFRIELGEIESALARHPAVRAAVVEARAAAGGDLRLVAWVVPAGAPVEATELRRHLARSLPDYMVPAAYVSLDRLPVTGHGKVDRRALPDPAVAGVGGAADSAAAAPERPRTRTESALAAIWRELLRVATEVGPSGNFFELGGHSLLVAQLASRIRARFGVEVPMRLIFEAPTLAGLAARIDELAPAGGGEAAGESGAAPIPRVPRAGPLPLSFAQERLWFLDRLEPASRAYHIAVALRLAGALEPAVLAAALRALVRRHESLRTTFVPVADLPRQVIGEGAAPALPVVDLRALGAGAARGAARREAAAQECLAAARLRLFDLERGPLLRVLLLRVADGEWRVLCELHHIVSDGWSNDVLVRELGVAYEALAAGRAPRLPELPIQYADFAAWQRRRIADDRLFSQLAWWRWRLEGAAPLLELPADRPRAAVQRYRGRVLRRPLDGRLGRDLAALCHAEGATLFMGLLTAFGDLLGRATGRSDVVIGTPVAGRDRTEIESVVGLFVNSVVLRTDFGGAPSFRQALARCREVALSAFSHQELPFDQLVEALAPRRTLGHAPIFQVMLVLQNPAGGGFSLPGLEVTEVPLPGTTAQLDLTLDVQQRDGELLLRWVFDRDLFDGATMARLAGQLRRLLAAAVADPDRRLDELPLLGAAERAALLTEWNDTESASAAGAGGAEVPGTIHDQFAAQAARTPDAVALVHGSSALSYRELAARAGRLARRLGRLGLPPGGRVGIGLERSLDVVVALLATLAAGGAYVPLDATQPRRRLAAMAEEARLDLAIAEGAVAAALPAGLRIVGLGALGGADAEEPAGQGALRTASAEESPGQGALGGAGAEEPPGHRAAPEGAGGGPRPVSLPDALAYLIFTSGSTGTPKAVMVNHRTVVAFFAGMDRVLGDPRPGCWLAVTNIGFDISVLELLWTLCRGWQVVVHPSAPGATAAEGLATRLLEAAATHLQCTPSLATALYADPEAAPALGQLRRLLLGGEALRPGLAADLGRALGSGSALLNMYGPTETTVWSSSDRVEPESGAVTLGRPIAGTRLFVVDRQLSPAPIGWPGELLIGGAGVARGYWERPELTAERFVPDPWSGLRGERLYRTGDLVRRLPDGRLAFLGRLDHQVKIRGYRVEIEEVQTVLARHPAVVETVVVSREEAPGDIRLVAYLVPREGPPAIPATPAAPLLAELRHDLLQRLPDYMVPSQFVALAALPRLPGGKVDRRALPPPPAEGRAGVPHTAPRDRTEAKLAAIWREVLRLPSVGIEDDFFALGGHSLLATQVLSRAAAALGVALPVRTLFETPTIAGLAAAMRRGASGGQATPGGAPPIGPLPRPQAVPLAYAQERLWFVEQLEGNAYNMPAVLGLHGALRVPALAAAVREIVRRHEALRTRFPVIAGRPVQAIEPFRPALVPLPLVDLARLPAAVVRAERERLTTIDEARPFDLARGPLLRVRLVRCAPDEFVLLVNMHHIISDGWSHGVVLRELEALYRAAATGVPSPLAELPVQYADFALWQRAWLSGTVLDEQLRYWTRQLAGTAPLELPADRPRLAGQLFAAGEIPVAAGAELTAALHRIARRQGASLFMVLLAAFQALVARHAGQPDVAVGTPIANRDWPEIEGLIGFFVNTLVLRTDLSGGPRFRDLLERVRETTLDAYDHQDLPFARVVEALRPDRRGGGQPLFDVMFTLQNQPAPEVELPDVRLEVLRHEARDFAISVDLSLRIWEVGGRLVGGMGYNTARLDRATAARWSGHWVALLVAIAAAPGQVVDELPLLSAGERHQLTCEWGSGADGADGVVVVLASGQPAPIGVWGAAARRWPGGGLERTGERARRLANGALEVAPARPAIDAAAAVAASAAPAGLAPAAADGAAALAVAGAAAADGGEVPESVARQRAELSSRADTLSAAKRELLEKRRRGRAAKVSTKES